MARVPGLYRRGARWGGGDDHRHLRPQSAVKSVGGLRGSFDNLSRAAVEFAGGAKAEGGRRCLSKRIRSSSRFSSGRS